MDCPNLKELFGERYKITRDPAAGPRSQDPWLWQIPCLFGEVYPHGANTLGVSTHRRGAIANRIMALACVTVTQNADDGINASFPLVEADAVFAIVKPRKRRRLSEKVRVAAIARFSSRKAQPSAFLAA